MVQAPSPEVLFSPDRIRERVRQLGAEIRADYADGSEVHLVSVLKGGVVFFADLLRALNRPATVDFVRLASYGSGMRPSARPKWVKGLEDDVADRDVLIVEDIVETGRTLALLVDAVRAKSPRSVRTVALLDKPCRRRVEIGADHVGFTISDRFVVGYGLDHAERYRDLPYIGALDPADGASAVAAEAAGVERG